MHKAQTEILGTFYVLKKKGASEPPSPCPRSFFPPKRKKQPTNQTNIQTNKSIQSFLSVEAVSLSKHLGTSRFSSLKRNKRKKKKGCFLIAILQDLNAGKIPAPAFSSPSVCKVPPQVKPGHWGLLRGKSQGPGHNSHSVFRHVGALEFNFSPRAQDPWLQENVFT